MMEGPEDRGRAPRIRRFVPADRAWVAELHRSHYREVEGFDASFEAAVGAALDDFVARRAPDRSRAHVIEQGERPGGCLFLFDEGRVAARIRLFLLVDHLRGRGIGRAVLARALDDARAAGFEEVRVATFERHAAACRLYLSAGFRETARRPGRAFGLDQVQRDFALALDPSPVGGR